MTGRFLIEVLTADHDRKHFSSGTDALDRYFREQAGQDVKRRTAVCYVIRDAETGQIAGYYTLSAGEMILSDIPNDLARKLPRYPIVPIARMGRLAIDAEYQGKGLGAAMLWDAASRSLRTEMGIYAVAVDAKDEKAAAFYRHHGFIAYQSKPLQLFLPIATVAKVL